MVGRYSQYENVTDFTEYKLHRLIDTLAKAQRLDIAEVLSNALDKYIMEEIDIVFVDGWPHIVNGTKQSDESDTQN